MALLRVWSGVPGELSRLIETDKPKSLVSELAGIWHMSKQRVRLLLAQGRVSGVYKNPLTGQWAKSPGVVAVHLKKASGVHLHTRRLVVIADPRGLIAWLQARTLRYGFRGEALSRLRRARSDLAAETLDVRRETYIQHPALKVVGPRVASVWQI